VLVFSVYARVGAGGVQPTQESGCQDGFSMAARGSRPQGQAARGSQTERLGCLARRDGLWEAGLLS
jgi:hypothetical protein